MGRQPKTDPVITLIVLLINAIVWLFKAIFFFIGNLFNSNSQEESYNNDVEMENYKLVKIGVETANCPYCNEVLSKFPLRKCKCKKCGQEIFIKTRPIDSKKVLLKESELKLLEDENFKRQEYCLSNVIIDAQNEAEQVIEILVDNYQKYCNYEEILNIPENLRLEIMEFVWNDWAYRNTEKRLYNIYQDINKKDLKYIAQKEGDRINTLVKVLIQYCDPENTEVDINNDLLQVYISSFLTRDYNFKVCLVKDIFDVYDMWKDKNGNIFSYDFKAYNTMFDPYVNPEVVYFWNNGEFKKYTFKEFKELCKKNKYNL